jgi:hypothetical protein
LFSSIQFVTLVLHSKLKCSFNYYHWHYKCHIPIFFFISSFKIHHHYKIILKISKQGSLDKYFVKRKQNNESDASTQRHCAENENVIIYFARTFWINQMKELILTQLTNYRSYHWRIQLFGEPTSAAPSRYFFLFFFSAEIRKKLLLSQISFENCFLTMTAALFDKPPSPDWFSGSAPRSYQNMNVTNWITFR